MRIFFETELKLNFSVFRLGLAKIYASLLNEAEKEDDWDRVYSLDNLMISKLPVFEQSDCLEAQERVKLRKRFLFVFVNI